MYKFICFNRVLASYLSDTGVMRSCLYFTFVIVLIKHLRFVVETASLEY